MSLSATSEHCTASRRGRRYTKPGLPEVHSAESSECIERCDHLGIRGRISRDTLADANATRNWRIFADFVFKGLRPLREHAMFARVEVGEGGHRLVWPCDIDMGADRLYEMALEQSGRADTVAFIRWRWRHGLSLSKAAEALGISRRQVANYASGEQEVPRTILLACKGWEVEHQDVLAA